MYVFYYLNILFFIIFCKHKGWKSSRKSREILLSYEFSPTAYNEGLMSHCVQIIVDHPKNKGQTEEKRDCVKFLRVCVFSTVSVKKSL